MTVTFRRGYFLATILLLCIEVLIALFVRDRFIRPYVGDVLVVMLIYCFVRSFLTISTPVAVLLVLLFASGVELLQYLHIVERMGMQHNALLSTVIGTSFSWADIIAYTVGCFFIWIVEKYGCQLLPCPKPNTTSNT